LIVPKSGVTVSGGFTKDARLFQGFSNFVCFSRMFSSLLKSNFKRLFERGIILQKFEGEKTIFKGIPAIFKGYFSQFQDFFKGLRKGPLRASDLGTIFI